MPSIRVKDKKEAVLAFKTTSKVFIYKYFLPIFSESIMISQFRFKSVKVPSKTLLVFGIPILSRLENVQRYFLCG